MASYKDIPMNSFDRYAESMRTRRPGITAGRVLQGAGSQLRNAPQETQLTPAEDAYMKFAAAREAEDQARRIEDIPWVSTNEVNEIVDPASETAALAEARLFDATGGMQAYEYEAARARQKAQEQAVTNSALDKFMAAQNKREAVDPNLVQ